MTVKSDVDDPQKEPRVGSDSDLVAVILEQRTVIAQLQKRVRELEQQLGLGGPKPPSVVAKPAAPRQDRKSRKPRSVNFSRPKEASTNSVAHFPETCPDCGRYLSGGSPGRTRQIVDIEPSSVRITDHVLYERWCGVCGKRVRAKVDFSNLVCGRRRIGHNLVGWIASLHIEARVPLRQIQAILQQTHGVHISEGEMIDLLALVAQKSATRIESIKEQVRSASCLHADETGWKENGAYKCLWSLSTRTARLFHIDDSRSAQVAQDLIGPSFAGTLVTDFYYAYNQIPGRHQRCWAHFYRALELLREHAHADPLLHNWIDAVIALWRRGRDYRQFCLTKPRFGASVFDRRRKRRELERQIWALAEPFIEADSAQVPQATLAKRIGMFLGELFTFVEYPEVPDDNNPAERAIRPAVIIRKVCGGTRSPKGTRVKATLMSLFATWKLEGKDTLQECTSLLRAPA